METQPVASVPEAALSALGPAERAFTPISALNGGREGGLCPRHLAYVLVLVRVPHP